MEMTNNINVAVIGLGNMGKNHVRNYSRLEQANLIAVCDVQKDIVSSFEKEFKCKGYTNLDNMLENENIQGSIMHKMIRKYSQSSGWYYPNLNDFINTLDNFSNIRYFTTGFFTILSRKENIKSKIFIVDNLIKKMVPDKSKYIIYGIAEK